MNTNDSTASRDDNDQDSLVEELREQMREAITRIRAGMSTLFTSEEFESGEQPKTGDSSGDQSP